jgi:hypothetical protein
MVAGENMKTIRFTHPDYPLIVKADLEWENNDAVVKAIKFGLPTKATKLEKLLLKYVEIYCFDVLRNNMYNVVVESAEYKKFVNKQRLVAA